MKIESVAALFKRDEGGKKMKIYEERTGKANKKLSKNSSMN